MVFINENNKKDIPPPHVDFVWIFPREDYYKSYRKQFLNLTCSESGLEPSRCSSDFLEFELFCCSSRFGDFRLLLFGGSDSKDFRPYSCSDFRDFRLSSCSDFSDFKLSICSDFSNLRLSSCSDFRNFKLPSCSDFKLSSCSDFKLSSCCCSSSWIFSDWGLPIGSDFRDFRLSSSSDMAVFRVLQLSTLYFYKQG